MIFGARVVEFCQAQSIRRNCIKAAEYSDARERGRLNLSCCDIDHNVSRFDITMDDTAGMNKV